MDLKDEVKKFYYSTALCDLYLMNQHIADQSLSHNTQMYLELIYAMEGSCTASRLAEVLGVSKAAVTLKINELMKQGMVVKVPDAADRRRHLLFVNDEKVAQYRIYRHQDHQALEKISEQFSAEDIEKFCRMLRIFSDLNFQACHLEEQP